MNFERAQEIVNSKGVIDVEYSGKSIWIKSVDKENNTAEIEGIDGKIDYKIVKLDKLSETT